MTTIPAEQLDAWESAHLAEKEQVRRLGSVIGYGNMISLARVLWTELLTPSLGEETAKRHTENWGCTCASCAGDESA
jgi:hypothetical protein